MLRCIIIIFSILVHQFALAQDSEAQFTEVELDSLIAQFNRYKTDESFIQDEPFRLYFRERLDAASSWAQKQVLPKQLARCRYLRLRYLFKIKSTDTYEKLVAANEVWILREHLQKDQLLKVLSQMNFLYQRTKRPAEQLRITLEICELKREADSLYQCGELAGIYHSLKQYDRAIAYYRNGIQASKEDENWLSVASLYNNIGLAYREMGVRDSAEHHFRTSLKLLNNKPLLLKGTSPEYLQHFTSVVKWNIQHLTTETITHEKVNLANNLIRSGAAIPEYIWVVKSYDLLARFNYERQAFGSAKLYADSALALAKDSKFMDEWVQLLHLKGKILLAAGMQNEADIYFNRFRELSDSVQFAEAALDASIAAAQYEAKEREEQLVSSQEEARISALEAKNEHRRSQWFTALFIGAVVILMLVVLLLRSSKKSQKLIALQKQQLEESLSEKEILLKEIHHRVKNNLQVISSLLDLQSNTLTDQVSQDAFQEGQNRVKSIALIHRQLYQTEELTGVEITTFVTALFKQIRAAMMKKGQMVKLQLKSKKILFDIDTAVPLGLVLNEMLTNSFKHAFREDEPSMVSIEFKELGAGKYELDYSDGGPGISKDIDIKKVRSLGLRLIYRLTRQLGGSIEINTAEGYLFAVNFLNADARKEQN